MRERTDCLSHSIINLDPFQKVSIIRLGQHTHTDSHTHTHTHTHRLAHTHTHTHTQTRTHTRTHMHKHTYTHTHTYTNSCTGTYARTHLHMHACTQFQREFVDPPQPSNWLLINSQKITLGGMMNLIIQRFQEFLYLHKKLISGPFRLVDGCGTICEYDIFNRGFLPGML